MAVTHPVARRYARAIFELAVQEDALDTVGEELLTFDRCLQEQPRLRAILLTPEVEKQQKESIVREITKANSKIFRNFVLLLVKKGRQNRLSDIRQEFDRLYDLENNRVRAEITSAVELDPKTVDKTREELARLLNAEVKLDTKVDPDILGGLIVRVDGMAMDGSLKKQLSILKEKLLKSSLV